MAEYPGRHSPARSHADDEAGVCTPGRPDWRDSGAYAACQSLDAAGFAWEYLRRNADFRSERSLLAQEERQGLHDVDKVEAFARRWGVCFPTADANLAGGTVAWAPHALPSVLVLTTVPPSLADPVFALDTKTPIDLGQPGLTTRLHVMPEGSGPPAVLLPFDRLFEQRARAAIRAWRTVTGRNPGPDPAALPKHRRDRLILALRALDGRTAKASYRDLADELFGASQLSGAVWKTHDLRDRTIRLARYGRSMVQGGYRRLLLHPYRRCL